MPQRFLIFENIEAGQRQRLFEFWGVTWFASPTAWLGIPASIVMGWLVAGLFSALDLVANWQFWGVIYGLLYLVVIEVHSLGHIASGKMIGKAMTGNLVTALRNVNLYQDTEDYPPRVHVIRSLGGPLLNIAVGLVSLLLYIGLGGHVLLFFGLINLLYGIIALLPLPSLDGELLLREYKARQRP